MNCREFENPEAPFDLFWDQLRLGTTYYQVQGLGRNAIDATAWFVILYLPLWPVGRYRLKRSGATWVRSQKLRLPWASVVFTYLCAYFFVPLALLFPLLPFTKEVFPATGLPGWAQISAILVVIALYVVAFWKALDRHESSFERATRLFPIDT